MPWRREEVAPYTYKDIYIPDAYEQFYYSSIKRTDTDWERRYRQVNGEPSGRYALPEDAEPKKKTLKPAHKKTL